MPARQKLPPETETWLQLLHQHLLKSRSPSTVSLYLSHLRKILVSKETTEDWPSVVNRIYAGKSSYGQAVSAVNAAGEFAGQLKPLISQVQDALPGQSLDTPITARMLIDTIMSVMSANVKQTTYPMILGWIAYCLTDEFWPKHELQRYNKKFRTVKLEDVILTPWSSVWGPNETKGYVIQARNEAWIYPLFSGRLSMQAADVSRWMATVLWDWGGWYHEDIPKGAFLFPENPRSNVPMDAAKLRALIKSSVFNMSHFPEPDFDPKTRRPDLVPLPINQKKAAAPTQPANPLTVVKKPPVKGPFGDYVSVPIDPDEGKIRAPVGNAPFVDPFKKNEQ